MRHIEIKHIFPIRRYILDMSQKELAQLSGVSRATINAYENGYIDEMKPKTREQLECAIFERIDPETLFILLDELERGNETILKGEIE